MPEIWIHDAEANFDFGGIARDRRCDRERAAVEGIFRHPESAETHFFGAPGVRGELARVQIFETDSEFADFWHRHRLCLLLVLEGHSRTLRAPGKVAMPHLPDRLAVFILADVHLGAAELAAARQRLAVFEGDSERGGAR